MAKNCNGKPRLAASIGTSSQNRSGRSFSNLASILPATVSASSPIYEAPSSPFTPCMPNPKSSLLAHNFSPPIGAFPLSGIVNVNPSSIMHLISSVGNWRSVDGPVGSQFDAADLLCGEVSSTTIVAEVAIPDVNCLPTKSFDYVDDPLLHKVTAPIQEYVNVPISNAAIGCGHAQFDNPVTCISIDFSIDLINVYGSVLDLSLGNEYNVDFIWNMICCLLIQLLVYALHLLVEMTN